MKCELVRVDSGTRWVCRRRRIGRGWRRRVVVRRLRRQPSGFESRRGNPQGQYDRVAAVELDSYLGHAAFIPQRRDKLNSDDVQRVDLIVDGKVRNTRQRSDLPAFEARLLAAIQTAARVEVVRSAPTPNGSPPSLGLDALAQRVVFFANVTEEATDAWLLTPKRVRAAITADPSYQGPQVDDLVRRGKAAGRSISPWCDCREPGGDPPGTPFRAAVAMRQRYGLDEPIGQAESPAEYDHAIAAGARILVGNPSALTQTQVDDAIARHARGELAFIGEVYRPDPRYSARGIPISSGLFGVALDGGLYQPVAEYLAVMPAGFDPTFGVYHAAGLRPADWHALT